MIFPQRIKNNLTICQLYVPQAFLNVPQAFLNVPKDVLLVHCMDDNLLAHPECSISINS